MNVEAGPVLRCARHPNVETGLRCGRCDTPICPRCSVMTPVGARCPTCAPVRKLPMFVVSPGLYARALGIAFLVGCVGGVVLALTRPWISFGYFLLVMALAYFAGGAVSWAARRRTSRGLQVLAAGTVVFAFIAQSLLLFAVRDPMVLLYPQIIGPLLLRSFVSLVANPLELLVIALAAWLAATRV